MDPEHAHGRCCKELAGGDRGPADDEQDVDLGTTDRVDRGCVIDARHLDQTHAVTFAELVQKHPSCLVTRCVIRQRHDQVQLASDPADLLEAREAEFHASHEAETQSSSSIRGWRFREVEDGASDDSQVGCQRDRPCVFGVPLCLLLSGHTFVAVHLREAGQTWLQPDRASCFSKVYEMRLRREWRARSNERHIAIQHVEQLRDSSRLVRRRILPTRPRDFEAHCIG